MRSRTGARLMFFDKSAHGNAHGMREQATRSLGKVYRELVQGEPATCAALLLSRAAANAALPYLSATIGHTDGATHDRRRRRPRGRLSLGFTRRTGHKKMAARGLSPAYPSPASTRVCVCKFLCARARVCRGFDPLLDRKL